MFCFQRTYSNSSVSSSVYSVKWNRTRQWIKDQEAKQGKVSGGTTQTFWKQLSDYPWKPSGSRDTHSCRPTGLQMNMNASYGEGHWANDRCINLLPVPGLNKQTKKILFLISCVQSAICSLNSPWVDAQVITSFMYGAVPALERLVRPVFNRRDKMLTGKSNFEGLRSVF